MLVLARFPLSVMGGLNAALPHYMAQVGLIFKDSLRVLFDACRTPGSQPERVVWSRAPEKKTPRIESQRGHVLVIRRVRFLFLPETI